MNKTAFKVGDQVTFNGGFSGTVIELYSPGMIVVRGERGAACIPVEDAQLRNQECIRCGQPTLFKSGICAYCQKANEQSTKNSEKRSPTQARFVEKKGA